MHCPFPGMDPWLEHPALWPGVHKRLVSDIGDDLAPLLAPRPDTPCANSIPIPGFR